MPLVPLPLSEFVVGKEVRVCPVTAGSGSRRGMISYVNQDDQSYDIMYHTSQATLPDEENAVLQDRLFEILPFEVLPLSSMDDPAATKEYANQLFQLQDFDAAYQYYIRAHKLIQESKSFNVGQRIIISLPPTSGDENGAKKSAGGQQKQRSGMYICVTVSDVVNDSEVDVMYDAEIKGRDEEEGVDASRVLLMISTRSDERELQRSLLMNLAKCSLKLTVRVAGWSCYWASLAVAFVQGEMDQYDEVVGQKRLCDANFVKAKALIAGSRPGLARKATEVVYQHDSKRGKQLSQEIDTFVKNRQKQNRILAKNVAEWVDKAMTINSQLQEGGQVGSNGEIEDLNLEEFDDDDEDYAMVQDDNNARRGTTSDELRNDPTEAMNEDSSQCLIQ